MGFKDFKGKYLSTLGTTEEKEETSREETPSSKEDKEPVWQSDDLLCPSEPGVPKFTYDKLKPNSFRCFKLVLNGESDALCGRLMSTYHQDNVLDWSKDANRELFEDNIARAIRKGLTGTGKYDALSYSWGVPTPQSWLYMSTISNSYKTPKSDKQVLMDHEPDRNGWIAINPALRCFLEEMRRRKYRRFIFIDALCINQLDIEEKAMQIPMMRNIYEYAGVTKIWLGQGNEAERSTLSRLDIITQNMQQSIQEGIVQLDPHNEESFLQANLPPPQDPVWRSIGEIMKRPYWSRLWTLQEGVVHQLAGRALAEVLCGDQTVPMDVFQRFKNACDTRELKVWILTGQTTIMPPSLHGFDALAEIRTCAESYVWGVTIDYLLPVILRREATASVDKVCGLLALVDHHTARKVAADLTLGAESVYVKFAKHYVLSGARESLLNHVTTRERRPGVPSWCPNFASPPQTFTLGTRWLGRAKVSDEHKEQMFRAGFQLKGKWEVPRRLASGLKRTTNFIQGRNIKTDLYDVPHPYKISLVPDSNWLLTHGLHLDTIASVIDLYSDADSYNYLSPSSIRRALDWDSQCLSLARECLPEDSEGFDMYARTLVANRIRLDLPASALTEHGNTGKTPLYDVENQHDFVTPYFTFKKYLMSVSDADHASSPLEPPPFDQDTKNYVQTLVRILRNRRFFATKGGRIGIGPADTQVGDKVVVLFFCATPYVLRESATSIRNHLVGECYVHGYMYGESLEMLERGEVGQNSWVLE